MEVVKLSVDHAKKIESKFVIGAKWLLYNEEEKKNILFVNVWNNGFGIMKMKEPESGK